MIDYTSIFEVLGVFARAFTQIDNNANRNLTFTGSGDTFRSLDNLREDFLDVLNDSVSERDALTAVQVLTDAKDLLLASDQRLGDALNRWIQTGLAEALGTGETSVAGVLRALQRAMHDDSESVSENAVTVSGVSAHAENVTDSRLYVTNQTIDAGEAEIDDERARNQTIHVECVRDHATHNTPEGEEEFVITPEVGPRATLRSIPVTQSVQIHPRNVITDATFQDETTGDFDHWTKHAGGSVFTRDIAAKRFHDASLKVTGDGATAGELRQDLVDRSPVMASGRHWALGAWVYVTSHTAGSVTVDLLVDGVASSLALVVDGSTATGQWLHLAGFEYLSRETYPNRVFARVRCSSDFDGVVNVDGICLAPATVIPHAGVQAALFQGATLPHAGAIPDRFSFSTTNDEAGTFQTFARERLSVALPSDSTSTINDSLAE